MSARPIRMAVWRYDRTQALYDGRVGLPGRELDLVDLPLEEIFSRAFTTGEFDVTELSFSNYLRLSVEGSCPYIGIPVFPSRSFRHGAFYVRADSGIARPQDLAGRRVGLREYSMTAALVARGTVRDQFGVAFDDVRWVMGDVDEREREVIELPRLHRPLDLTLAPEGELLSDMLLDGRLDAIVAYKPIRPVEAGDPRVKRLFAEPAAAEEQYYRQFGIFPVMHLIGIRKELAENDPELVRAVFRALVAAHELAMADFHIEQALKIALPWLRREVQRTIDVMGADFWPTGLSRNRATIERMIEWSWADGLIPAKPTPEALFAAAILDT